MGSSPGSVAKLGVSTRGCSSAELFVVLLVFGLMWTCGGLSLQARLSELRCPLSTEEPSR